MAEQWTPFVICHRLLNSPVSFYSLTVIYAVTKDNTSDVIVIITTSSLSTRGLKFIVSCSSFKPIMIVQWDGARSATQNLVYYIFVLLEVKYLFLYFHDYYFHYSTWQLFFFTIFFSIIFSILFSLFCYTLPRPFGIREGLPGGLRVSCREKEKKV